MKKNDTFTVTCTDLTDQGFGVAHVDGMTVFVSGLLPQEEAVIRIVKPFKKYAIARVEKRLGTSPDRTTPVCEYAGKCGGCAFQHVQYSSQLKWKQKQLQELFEKVSPDILVLPVKGMDSPYAYRNKAQFPIQVQNGKIVSGFYRSRTNEIVDMEHCAIQSDRINEVFAWIKAHLPLNSAKPLRHIFIRESHRTGQVQVVFIGKADVGLKAFAQQLHEHFPMVRSVVFNENLRDDNVILGEKYQVLYGSDSILEDCLGLSIQLHFKSFFQVNPIQMEVLYSEALKLADLKPDDEVIELYSGTGTIGMLASRQARHVTGVEIVEEAVENARANVRLNHIENADFVCEDASKFAAENENKADVVFVDPPRKGMTAQGIHDILRLQPKKIVYISCNPRTLVRDLDEFQKAGYQCREVQPVDMFAHSANIECVALLQKNLAG